MAQTTANYNLNIAEGTDTVNLLTQCYPNFTSLDSIIKGIDDSALTVASETKSGTVHQLVRTSRNRNVMRFSATSNYTLGDTFTVDGTPVTAVTIAGTALQTGDFVINSNVIAILNGAQLTVLVGGSASGAASDITYDNTGSGLTATNVQDAIDEVEGNIPSGFAATAITYDNSVSGLTAADVQAAIDELKSLIGANQYITTGLSTYLGRCTINAGGYYLEGSTVHIDITVTTTQAINNGDTIVRGFPYSNTPGDNTPVYNGGKITSTGTYSDLVAGMSLASGATVHFIGSYVIA